MRSPIVTSEMLDWLDHLFPDTVPMTDSECELFRAQGQQQVIRKIRAEHNSQNDPTYE